MGGGGRDGVVRDIFCIKASADPGAHALHLENSFSTARDRTCITSNHRTGDGGLSGEGGVKKGAK